MIKRYCFHRGSPGDAFLTGRLAGARSYDRIAGYFDSSLLEFAGEAFESVTGSIRIVCNSSLKPADVETAQGADHAQKLSFFRHNPEALSKNSGRRLERLHSLLTASGGPALEVRVLPDEAFGLIHGKAGVITLSDGRRTSFLGSANETFSGWNLNYELVWEDDSDEACDWVEAEFLRLWSHPLAMPLSKAVIKEVERLTERRELNLSSWKKKPSPEGTVIESPVFREEFGLWPHQRYFVHQFWKAHQTIGARYVLADQVGLGKTVQMGMAAQLMALTGDKPVLVLLPKTLMIQWQTELWDLMEIPSARWTGKAWMDETGFEYPPQGKNPLLSCPRRIGLVSQGLVTRGSDLARGLLQREWEGVLVDEAHRARRKKLPKSEEYGTALGNVETEANRLYAFLYTLASRTRSMLMSTATPIQMHPVEAWDLLRILSEKNDHVLGSTGSRWRRPEDALPFLLKQQDPPEDEQERWDWMRNPLPPAWEDSVFEYTRKRLFMDTDTAVVVEDGRIYGSLPADVRSRIKPAAADLFSNHHPFLRHIVRRTRSYLEEKVDPKTGEPYLKKIAVELIDAEPVYLQSYLKDGYDIAETFCRLLAKRVTSAGFFKTLLLRRIGSSIKAGLSTIHRMLDTWDLDEEEEDDTPAEEGEAPSELKQLTQEETALLHQCKEVLELGLKQQQGADPKRDVILDYLQNKGWAADGCILFSQYHDTARWMGEEIAAEFPMQPVALYAGSGKSGIWEGGAFLKKDREIIKERVRSGDIKILLGTDAASEGLNLQALGTLINIDLPWNPTRLEQRKGRIQRIGQRKDRVKILNLRYKDSVEDRVHEALSARLQQINLMFGQIPDVLQDVWIELALNNEERAEKMLEDLPETNPFDDRYSEISSVPEWDTWAEVLNRQEKLEELKKGWQA